MRILTVRQPYAWAIIHGGKDVENRVRNIAGGYRGMVAIHAGLDVDRDAVRDDRIVARWEGPTRIAMRAPIPGGGIFEVPDRKAFVLGVIIGVVDLVDVHAADWCWDDMGDGPRQCSAWAEPGVHHLVLANPRPLVEPIPFRGALGLRELDPATTTRVLKALAA